MDRLLGDHEVAPLEPAEDEEVLDDPEQPIGLRLDVRGELVGGAAVVELPAEEPRAGEDRRDRRPELVRDHADERLLELLRLALAGVEPGPLERLAALVGHRREQLPGPGVERPGHRPADDEHAAPPLDVAERPRDEAAHAGHRRQVGLAGELAPPGFRRGDLDRLAGPRGAGDGPVDVGGQPGLALGEPHRVAAGVDEDERAVPAVGGVGQPELRPQLRHRVLDEQPADRVDGQRAGELRGEAAEARDAAGRVRCRVRGGPAAGDEPVALDRGAGEAGERDGRGARLGVESEPGRGLVLLLRGRRRPWPTPTRRRRPLRRARRSRRAAPRRRPPGRRGSGSSASPRAPVRPRRPGSRSGPCPRRPRAGPECPTAPYRRSPAATAAGRPGAGRRSRPTRHGSPPRAAGRGRRRSGRSSGSRRGRRSPRSGSVPVARRPELAATAAA